VHRDQEVPAAMSAGATGIDRSRSPASAREFSFESSSTVKDVTVETGRRCAIGTIKLSPIGMGIKSGSGSTHPVRLLFETVAPGSSVSLQLVTLRMDTDSLDTPFCTRSGAAHVFEHSDVDSLSASSGTDTGRLPGITDPFTMRKAATGTRHTVVDSRITAQGLRLSVNSSSA